MSDRSTCTLAGAIRLTDSPEGIGIPIYTYRRQNRLYVGETDYDLRITRFIECEDADQYHIEYGIDSQKSPSTYTIGDFTPIPYWQDDAPQIVSGGITLAEFDDKFGMLVTEGNVFNDLRRIIYNSRTQLFQEIAVQAASQGLTEEYRDIFMEYPVHSKYWVSRYKSAVLRTTRFDGTAAAQLKKELRSRALDWISNFRFKGNLRLLLTIMKVAEGPIFDREEVRIVLFDCFINRLQKGDLESLRRNDVREIIANYFPEGIQYYCVWDKDTVRAAITEVERRLGFELMRAVNTFNFTAYVSHYLEHDDIWPKIDSFLMVTMIVYGHGHLPPAIDRKISTLYEEAWRELFEDINLALQTTFRDYYQSDNWRHAAKQFLERARKLGVLQRIQSGTSRLTGEGIHVDLPQELLAEVRRYANSV